jgi:hypothetical protein
MRKEIAEDVILVYFSSKININLTFLLLLLLPRERIL